ncbi:MAG: hypothetical protein AAF579_22855, partial [Cyanobacteria bacterium P01_C01_bin.118]
MGVASTGETLAIIKNVQASALGESDFAIVPDVSDSDESAESGIFKLRFDDISILSLLWFSSFVANLSSRLLA